MESVVYGADKGGFKGGLINIHASKSAAHRMIICALLSDTPSKIELGDTNIDIKTSINVANALGAGFRYIESENKLLNIGRQKVSGKVTADCSESGSTLRFFIPVAAALGINTVFTGHGRLPERPVDIYKGLLEDHGVTAEFTGKGIPLEIKGKLQGGLFELPGDVS